MGQRVARIGDQVTAVCSVHGQVTGTFNQGSNVGVADGLGICLVGHTGLLTCGHGFQATAGSHIMDVQGVPVVRVGDPVIVINGATGDGTITTGSPTVDTA